jgi:histidinol phosphatase-like enzyme
MYSTISTLELGLMKESINLDQIRSIVVDIDGTICLTEGSNYQNSIPILERIAKINKLHERGIKIVFFTARGMGSTNNNSIEAIEKWYEFTNKQLISWGVKFDRLYLGKISGDLYVDDKGSEADVFFESLV